MDYKELIKRLRASNRDCLVSSEEVAAAIETLLAERDAAVTVVRCKDCKHCILIGRPPFMFRACNRNGAIRTVDEDDFCKYGTPPDRQQTES